MKKEAQPDLGKSAPPFDYLYSSVFVGQNVAQAG
jgi:hypothetical protein